MKIGRLLALIGAVAIVATSCAKSELNYGTEFSMAVADSFQPGVTTEQEAIAKLGKPESVQATSSGGHRVAWQYARNTATVTPGSAKGSSIREGIAIIFNANGVMERVDKRVQTTGSIK